MGRSPSPEQSNELRNTEQLKQRLVARLASHLAETKPREPRRNATIVEDAQMLLDTGRIPLNRDALPKPGELIDAVTIWREQRGTNAGR